jgi:hypothetical protein
MQQVCVALAASSSCKQGSSLKPQQHSGSNGCSINKGMQAQHAAVQRACCRAS